MTRRAPYLVACYLFTLVLVLACLVLFSIAGDGWRAFGLSCVLVLLVMLRRTLTEEETSTPYSSTNERRNNNGSV